MKIGSNNVLSLAAVVVAAVLFGMMLSGGLDMTQTVGADRSDTSMQATPAAVNFLAPDFVALSDRVIPSVVSVRVIDFRSAREQAPQDRFHFFFRQQPTPEDEEPMPRRSEGSGFFITANGEIITNNHVIEDADKIEVELVDGTTYAAEVVGSDPATDLALIRVKKGSGNFPHLPLGDSETLRVGEWVMAAGNPLNMDHTITVGVVSAKGRALGLSDRSFENYIQTDAAINFGNSGGPLVNLRGEVIGINAAINARGQNLGFAIPINTAARIVPQLREHGKVIRGYLGVSINNIDQKAQGAFGLESKEGAMVVSVTEDSPAEKAGLTHGDVIVEVDGQAMKDTRTLIDTVAALPPGHIVTLDVIRDGKLQEFKVTLGERDADTEASPVDKGEGDDADAAAERIGVAVTTVDDRVRQMTGIDEGVTGVMITRVRPDSPAGLEGLVRGDIILEANGRNVKSVEDLLGQVRDVKEGGYLRLYVLRPRAERSFFSILELGE
ncbi:MAG: peptidase [Acidobacteria bacterium]|nr:MAG: peptidase [Acidobacteriota bacterium]